MAEIIKEAAMALDYTQSAALMQDGEFHGRVKVACLKFASYILDEAASVPAHQTRIKWSQATFSAPDNAAQQVQPPVVMDPSIQAAGAAVTDGDLQTAVETVVNKML
jgi:hypothetical protein